MTLKLRVAPGRDKSVVRRHPWLFSGAVESSEGDPDDGLVEVYDVAGAFLGRGFAGEPGASLVARIVTVHPDHSLDAAFFRDRIERAASLRAAMIPPGTTGFRLLNAEGDLLPGIVADRYDDVLVVQVTSWGAERARDLWLPALTKVARCHTVVLRRDLRSPGSPTGDEVLAGTLPREPVAFLESGLSVLADVTGGQKTGWYLDQRENRWRLGRLARGRRLLDLFCHHGGFGLAALRGGAEAAVEVDSSKAALELARRIRELNGLPVADQDFLQADVFEDLRNRVATGEVWDMVVLDPPPFAKKQADTGRALRGYRDINRLAMHLLRPGGLLLSCSCSGLVDPLLFQKTLFGAALEAHADLRILARWGAGPDHPVSIWCPEGEYLKAFLLERV
jgi:23S rRNA (cytosine1962-C5)-methyltransferase